MTTTPQAELEQLMHRIYGIHAQMQMYFEVQPNRPKTTWAELQRQEAETVAEIRAYTHREQVRYHLAKMKELLKDVEWIPNGEGRIYSVPMRTIEAKIEAEQKKLKEGETHE